MSRRTAETLWMLLGALAAYLVAREFGWSRGWTALAVVGGAVFAVVLFNVLENGR